MLYGLRSDAKSFGFYECKEGEDILSFAMHAAPKCIKELIAHYELSKDEVDFFLIH